MQKTPNTYNKQHYLHTCENLFTTTFTMINIFTITYIYIGVQVSIGTIVFQMDPQFLKSQKISTQKIYEKKCSTVYKYKRECFFLSKIY